MKSSQALLLLSAAAVLVSGAAPSTSPLQKVLELLDGMRTKGKQAKHDEEIQFAKFRQFCDSTQQATTKSIGEAKQQIEQFGADIAKAEADAERLGSEAAELDVAVARAEKAVANATRVRKQEHSDFLATEADFSESIDAIERALVVLRSREKDVPQSLLQVADLPKLPAEARATIQSFLAAAPSDEVGFTTPQANAYEFQSGGVVELLEKLRHKFQDQKLALQKAEMNGKANFEVLAHNLEDDMKEDRKRSKEKVATKGQRLENAATAKGEMQMTETAKAEDEKALADTLTSCHARAVEFEKNQNVRAEEIKAIEQAMEILRSDDVAGSAEKHLPQFLQVAARAAVLVQLRGGESPQDSHRREMLASFLQGRARQLGSRYLALVATHASEDAFSKVKKMIQDLIVKLMEQANSEADHKAYCDAELATNKETRENKQSEVEEISANVDIRIAESERLAEELTQLADALRELRQQQAEATALRQQEAAMNAETVKDAKAAQVAVERAIKVLRDFYQKAKGDEAFIQEPYRGMQSEHGGVVGFLEVILSDFARLEAETTTEEDQSATAYEKFMDESNENIAVKETESKHKTDKKRDVDAQTESLKKELDLTQAELDAANKYFEKLRPECIDHGLSYEDRVRMREEEIQSLKEALTILEQQDVV